MKKVLLVVCVVALLAVASAAYASDSAWYVQIKAVHPTSAGGGAGITTGVGTTTELTQGWPTTVGSTANAEYSTGDVAYHSRHDVARDIVGTEEYAWNLKIGARSDYARTDIRIALWNNKTALAGNGGDLNHALAYAFYKGDSLLAWFSDAGAMKTQYTDYWKRTELVDGLWNDTALLGKNSSTWSPSSTNFGFYVTDTVTKSVVGGFSDLADYRFEAFGYEEEPVTVITPEPGSLMALGSGLIGLAGFAIRRRK